MEIYLDNSATTRPHQQVLEAMWPIFMERYGNPSSLHNKGLEGEQVLSQARRQVATLLGVKPEEIYYTSGGTESNNLAIQGVARAFSHRGRHIITSVIEHPSVLETVKALEKQGYHGTYLPVDRSGLIDPEDLAAHIGPETILVTIAHVNNEMGAIQKLEELGRIIKKVGPRAPFFHVDAVQSFGKLDLKPRLWGVDLLTISGHKIHGPKGSGALYIREGVEIEPILWGGGQEANLRSGTENVPGIGGLGEAARLAQDGPQAYEYVQNLKDSFLAQLKVDYVLNSPPGTSPYILNVSFPPLSGEIIVHSLEEKGVYVSTGSACSSRSHRSSHVLEALGLSQQERAGAIRISFSRYNTLEEVMEGARRLTEVVKELREIML
ncbi:MAG: cysteine desulfurase family protein [Limnochordia bacterium]